MGVGRPRAVHTVRSRCRQQVGARVPMHVPGLGCAGRQVPATRQTQVLMQAENMCARAWKKAGALCKLSMSVVYTHEEL